jgi:uncharacterized protein YndB with AHSA1/START domain
MPSVRRTRKLDAAPEIVWDVVADPHHLPRWWPNTRRVEAVDPQGWTSVLATEKGKQVRADYRVLRSERPLARSWAQELDGSPFERILNESVIEVELDDDAGATRVTLVARQRLRGLSRLGGFLVRRATARQLDEALEGLERACTR